MPGIQNQQHPDLAPGAIVRTRRVWPGGIHKARVTERDGETWAEGPSWAYPASQLEVIRPALR